MANMCDNSVVFTGDPLAVQKVKALFRGIQEKQDATGKWYLPPYVTAEFSYMLDISMEDDKINYETRWDPNLEALVQIADHFELDFVNKYDELANGVFGEATYSKGEFSNIALEPQDFPAYDYDNETELYVYEGKNYSYQWPIFELILEKKKEHNEQALPERQIGMNR